MFSFQDINFWAVLTAAVSKVFIGSFWYSPFILGKSWMKENGFTEADFIEGHPLWMMALLSISFAFVAALAMALFIPPHSTALTGMVMGLIVSIAWISASKANTRIYENYSRKLFLIHAGYDIIGYSVMGAIIGAWH